MISKRHCAVLKKDGKAYVRDFSSTNGTFVNGEPVQGERELLNGDILKAGPLQFRVALEQTAPVNRPTPPPAKSKADMGDDESIAALLLGPLDGSDADSTPSEDSIPEGSTIMEIPNLPEEDKPKEEAKPKEKVEAKKQDKAKDEKANTAAAAAAILEMYRKRPRS
jgi:pSer/pThr/pTyr-binding forkhead associated (FHA) protein